ncbi:MAG: hypothetical protein KDD69_17820 [Bdellovibrionales bacterium]|nr:hypothetical protein [Bdellovibrionales bacterium]
MNENEIVAVFILSIGAVVFSGWYFFYRPVVRYYDSGFHQAWKEFADLKGLRFVLHGSSESSDVLFPGPPGFPAVVGLRAEHRQFELRATLEGNDTIEFAPQRGHSPPVTVARVYLSRPEFAGSLITRKNRSFLASLLAPTPTLTGDQIFDKEVSIVSAEPNRILSVLGTAERDAIRQLIRSYAQMGADVGLEDTSVFFYQKGLVSSANRLARIFEDLMGIAEVLDPYDR